LAILHHGTTRQRAQRIVAAGPDPDFMEPGGSTRADGFSACLEAGPFPLGKPEDYARHKAAAFPVEGGPVILEVEVPDDIIELATDDVFLPLTQGVVQFDELVTLCAGNDLEIDWRPDRVRIRLPGGEWDELTDELPRKSVLRAASARVAALCNEHRPDSVSPYGGSALLTTRTNPAASLRATLVNTADEQGLRLEPARG
jgi:hypothetical protein